MTPREIQGCLYFAQRREARKQANQLALNTLASRGEPTKIKQQIGRLQAV